MTATATSTDELARAVRNAQAILFDIDGTITGGRYGGDQAFVDGVMGNGVLNLMAEELVRSHEHTIEEAEEKIATFANALTWWDYPDFIAEFGLEPKRMWLVIERWHQAMLRPHADAVVAVQALAKGTVPIAVMSNNPVVGCLLKLQVAGLANCHGSSIFGRIFGSNNLRGQKSNLAMWQRCLAHLGVPGEGVVMIGDNPVEDGERPRQAGIGSTIIVDREQATGVESRDGAIWVNSLETLAAVVV